MRALRDRSGGRGLATALAGLALAGAACAAVPAGGGDRRATPLAEWIAAEVARVEAAASGLGGDGESIRAGLVGVRADAAAGRELWAAWRLAGLRTVADGHVFVAARRGEVTAIEALDREAAAAAVALARSQRRYDEADGTHPAALAAFADTLRQQAPVYQATAAAYGRASGLADGLFYVGSAASMMAAALELSALGEADGRPRPPAPGGLAAELDALDRRAVAAYRRPGAETEQHTPFIVLNSRIKEARELLAAGRLEAAELATLDALRRLAEIEDTAAPADPALLRRRAAEWRARLAAAGWDASLGSYFLEMAESALAAEAPAPGDLRRARAALDVALPRYLELTEGSP